MGGQHEKRRNISRRSHLKLIPPDIYKDYCIQVFRPASDALFPFPFGENTVDGEQRLCPVSHVVREAGKGEVYEKGSAR